MECTVGEEEWGVIAVWGLKSWELNRYTTSRIEALVFAKATGWQAEWTRMKLSREFNHQPWPRLGTGRLEGGGVG